MAAPQFTLYSADKAPNPLTVVFVLKALNLNYKLEKLDMAKAEHKAPAYLAINPNGKLPALIDHKTGLTVWDSKAILLYLVENYDPHNSLTVTDALDRAHLYQYLFLQSSGQSPYFAQAYIWKNMVRPEVPAAIERYAAEVARVFGVLENILEAKRDSGGWLVGGKVTIADLAFLTWTEWALDGLFPEGVEPAKEFPLTLEWHARLKALPYVEAAYAEL